MKHGEHLAPLIDAAMNDAGIVRQDLTAIAVGVGPGPFTGLRVGLVTARTLGFVLEIPVYGVCSLDVLAVEAAAAQAAATGAAGFLVATDARRKEVYLASYDEDGHRADRPGGRQAGRRRHRRPVWPEPGPALYPEAFPHPSPRSVPAPAGWRAPSPTSSPSCSTPTRSTCAAPTRSPAPSASRCRDPSGRLADLPALSRSRPSSSASTPGARRLIREELDGPAARTWSPTTWSGYAVTMPSPATSPTCCASASSPARRSGLATALLDAVLAAPAGAVRMLLEVSETTRRRWLLRRRGSARSTCAALLPRRLRGARDVSLAPGCCSCRVHDGE